MPDSPCCPSATRASGALPVIQSGRTGRSLRAPADLRRPPGLKRLCSCSVSPAPSPRPNPPRAEELLIGSTGLLGANHNPRLIPEGPSQGAWRRNAGDWGPRALAPDSPCCPSATQGLGGAAVHSGWENEPGPPRHGDLRRPPVPKRPGPHSQSPAPSVRSATSLSTQVVNRACRSPGG